MVNVYHNSPVGQSKLEWSLYRAALETDEFFLPMITKRSFSIIPKRAFASQADIDSFRAPGLTEKLGAVDQI